MPSSAWTTTANSISLVPITTSIGTGSTPENVNYLTNADKITLMAQYAAMLATKTTLDETASTLGISSSFYDNACANISTTLIAAGAPSNWATIWPDGTTSGPWPDIQGDLENLWAQIASQQTALQTAISSSQAAAAEIASVNAAVAAALVNMIGVPNGDFRTGDTTGWVSQTNTSIASLYGTLPNSAKGLTLLPGNGPDPSSGAVSHSFAVTPGQEYALTYVGFGDAGNSSVYCRIYYSTKAYSSSGPANICAVVDGPDGYAGYTDLFVGPFPTTTPTNPVPYTWIPPSGVTYASLVVINSGATGDVYLQAVQAVPYVSAAAIAGTLSAAQIASLAASQITGQLTAAQIASLTAAQLTGQITSTQISDGAVSTPQLAAGAVTAAQIAANTITAGQIASGSITSTEIAAGTVTAANIAAGTIQASNIAAGAVTADQLAANSVSAGNIQANAITSGAISAGAVTANALAAGSVTTAALTASCVTAGNIAAGAITADMITTGTLNAALVSVTNLNASNITTGTLAATQVVFPDGTAVSTASRVVTYPAQASSAPEITASTPVAIAGLSWTVTSSGPTDTFNILGAIESAEDTSVSGALGAVVMLVVDGNTGSPAGSRSLPQTGWVPAMFSVTSLAAGTHSFALYTNNAAGYSILSDSYALLQHIH